MNVMRRIIEIILHSKCASGPSGTHFIFWWAVIVSDFSERFANKREVVIVVSTCARSLQIPYPFKTVTKITTIVDLLLRVRRTVLYRRTDEASPIVGRHETDIYVSFTASKLFFMYAVHCDVCSETERFEEIRLVLFSSIIR